MSEWNINQVYTHLAPDGCEWICCRVAGPRAKAMDITKMPEHTLQSRLLASADLKLILSERSKHE